MNRFYAVLQVVLAAILYLMAFAILVNTVRIAFRPETISVVNAIIGLTVMLIGSLALARILMKKGLANLSQLKAEQSKPSISLNDSQP
jgi:multisubunit Na+/H+ antiporter MnhF subunit